MKEARYALAIERTMTKDEILERYLNIAYFGNGVYGIGTAASFYFGKPVQQLTLAEGATLAGIVQSPGRFDPVKAMADPAVMERAARPPRRRCCRAWPSVGFITEADARPPRPPSRRCSRIRPVAAAARPPACRRRTSATTSAACSRPPTWARRSARPARSARARCSPAG